MGVIFIHNSLFLIVGLMIGSFLNVCITRIPKNISVIFPGSYCTECKHALPFFLKIPVVSFIILRGKCKYCSFPIPWQYPFIEVLTGILTIFLFHKLGLNSRFLFYLIMTYFVIVISMIDSTAFLIHNRVLVVFLLSGILINGLFTVLTWNEAILGGVIGGSVMYLIALFGKKVFKKEALGMGDVKLSFVLGFFVGKSFILPALYAGFLLALLYALGQRLTGKKLQKRYLPLGPFLCAGSLMFALWGELLFMIYWKMVNPI
jgi:leader peptidase (prepilin peptidase)/N-methyltransferase